jgi:hypothetical protein
MHVVPRDEERALPMTYIECEFAAPSAAPSAAPVRDFLGVETCQASIVNSARIDPKGG